MIWFRDAFHDPAASLGHFVMPHSSDHILIGPDAAHQLQRLFGVEARHDHDVAADKASRATERAFMIERPRTDDPETRVPR